VALVLVLFILAVDTLPLWLFWDRISARASKWQVQPVWYFRFAEIGWFLGLLSMYVLVGMLLAFISKTTEVQGWMIFWAFLFGGLIGGTFAPAASYVTLRMRTTPDPDYGPLDSSED
jgi:hypothetical protein